MFAVYAFSRLVDDAVDEAPDTDSAVREIELWRGRVALVYSDQPFSPSDHPILPELREAVRRFQIPQEYLLDLITGMEMDLLKKRYMTYEELETYAYYVAGTVGLMCQHIFGAVSGEAKRGAVLLGKAFQLTNILRDVGSDAKRNRIYLPQEDLNRFGVSEADILARKSSLSLLKLLEYEAHRAESLYRQAFEAIPSEDLKRMKSALVMNAIYYRILQKLKKENFPVFDRKVSLSFPEKLFHILPVLL